MKLEIYFSQEEIIDFLESKNYTVTKVTSWEIDAYEKLIETTSCIAYNSLEFTEANIFCKTCQFNSRSIQASDFSIENAFTYEIKQKLLTS